MEIVYKLIKQMYAIISPTDEDNCGDVNPCQNGGACTDGYGMYWCQCPTGFAGVNCTGSVYCLICYYAVVQLNELI